MVTFSLPGDNDVAEPSNATPRSRPPLPFAKRAYAASPHSSAPRRLGTPQGASARKTLTTRDDTPVSSVSRSFAGARNIFRASTITDSPPTSSFSPSLSQTPMKKVFAPGATPEPSRVQRETTAQATPRGVAAKANDKELFPMRIASPPRELSGEALTQKVPKDWDPKGSIYADQFLAHLCPPDFDDEQRRQFFCILDLRRLKYAANEIFCKKGWKLNVLNFAKEFEKSRSIIMLHYGLYEFQNVKPSKELIKRWRREHGLPVPEDEAETATPSKSASPKKKRKAVDDGSDGVQASASKTKRRSTVTEGAPAPAATPVPSKNKRKASVSEDLESQPSSKKPSGARSLFEKAANKTSTTPAASPAKSSLFASSKPAGTPLVQSVLKNNAKSDAATQQGSNIFGHLSDNGSAKNSGQEADAESETDSESEETPEDAQSDEPRAKRPAISAPETGTSSAAGTRESTPGRSLFDRVTKDDEGQLVRSAPVEAPSPAKDQTWNPSTTPIKFAPTSTPAASTTPAAPLFGNAGSSTGSSLFAPKNTPSSNLFSAPKQDKAAEADEDGGESDKENDSQAPNKALPEPKPAATQSSLFAPKPTSTEPQKEAEAAKTPASNMFAASAAKPAGNIFGAPASKPTESSNMFASTKPASTSNIFGSATQSSGTGATNGSAVMQSSTLFGAKNTEPEKPAASEPVKSPPMFGASSTNGTNTASSLFGAKPTSTSGNLFGNNASTAPTKPLFGTSSSTSEAPAASSTPAPTNSTPTFSFGGNSQPNGLSTSKPLFEAPKSPPATGTNSMFDGSPMKQDDKSPAKPLFSAGNNASSSGSMFNFGNSSQNTPSSNMFGGASNPPAAAPASANTSFGSTNENASTNGSAGGSFNFNFGGAPSTGTSFNNPFTFGDKATNGSTPNTGGTFNFGASSAPSTGGTFQFGGNNNSGNSTPSGGLFGANQSNTNGAPAFGGGQTGQSTAPVFNFGGASQPQQSTGSVFGNNQGNAAPAINFQPPSGGPSTGTNTPSILGGGSSLATTPARGTPEPSSQAEASKGGDEEEGEKHEQINLTEGAEEGEEVLHEVRAKVLKFVPADKSEGDDKPKSKSPWTTQGVGSLRLLKNKETSVVRLLLRAEPRGHVALNRALLPNVDHKANEKYVKLMTSNETGDGLETWMLQVKTKDLAKALAETLETNKEANKK